MHFHLSLSFWLPFYICISRIYDGDEKLNIYSLCFQLYWIIQDKCRLRNPLFIFTNFLIYRYIFTPYIISLQCATVLDIMLWAVQRSHVDSHLVLLSRRNISGVYCASVKDLTHTTATITSTTDTQYTPKMYLVMNITLCSVWQSKANNIILVCSWNWSNLVCIFFTLNAKGCSYFPMIVKCILFHHMLDF